MGTSASLKPTVKGESVWGDFTKTALALIRTNNFNDNESIKNLMSKYHKIISSERGNQRFGSAGVQTLSNFIEFTTLTSQLGLNKVINDKTGEVELLSVNDVIHKIVSICTEKAHNFDEISAKAALYSLLEEIFQSVDDVEEVEKVLEEASVDMTEYYLYKYMAYYIFEYLSVLLEEKVMHKDKVKKNSFFNRVKEYIFMNVEQIAKSSHHNQAKWDISQSDLLINQVKENVLEIFC